MKLAYTFGSNDLLRNKVSDTAKDQVMLACRCVKNIFEQAVMEGKKVCEEKDSDVEKRVQIS